MTGSTRSVVFRRGEILRSFRYVVGLVIGLFIFSMVGYTVDLFAVTGGLVWLPLDAALLGVIGSGVVAYDRSGLVFAWASMYAALLGWYRALPSLASPNNRSANG